MVRRQHIFRIQHRHQRNAPLTRSAHPRRPLIITRFVFHVLLLFAECLVIPDIIREIVSQAKERWHEGGGLFFSLEVAPMSEGDSFTCSGVDGTRGLVFPRAVSPHPADWGRFNPLRGATTGVVIRRRATTGVDGTRGLVFPRAVSPHPADWGEDLSAARGDHRSGHSAPCHHGSGWHEGVGFSSCRLSPPRRLGGGFNPLRGATTGVVIRRRATTGVDGTRGLVFPRAVSPHPADWGEGLIRCAGRPQEWSFGAVPPREWMARGGWFSSSCRLFPTPQIGGRV